ncbi:unnamed protein product [Acanthoscelides obtectus]|uniref:Secreted protein n=1 Tax=Acanthoscelides obtectus TaxID=200917 RepID=A0A9P0JPK9_ACAOB|nr:unnamed protein product [Acanthoscelides obtectus]CAK1667054.1 hypothetical protein AOBTE_LOCUS25647 [Acanthoscelides obtectus]
MFDFHTTFLHLLFLPFLYAVDSTNIFSRIPGFFPRRKRIGILVRCPTNPFLVLHLVRTLLQDISTIV